MTKLGQVVFLLLTALTTSLTPMRPLGAQEQDELVERLQEGIRWLLRKAPGRPLYQDVNRRRELARAILEAAEEFDNDPFLLTAMVYAESSFRPTAVGPIGELGLLQLHGPPERHCDLESVRGQLRCGSRYLRVLTDACGSVRGGVTAYLSGRCLAPRGELVDRAVNRRLRLAHTLSTSCSTRCSR